MALPRRLILPSCIQYRHHSYAIKPIENAISRLRNENENIPRIFVKSSCGSDITSTYKPSTVQYTRSPAAQCSPQVVISSDPLANGL
ncbi:hypothetical protein CTI12_AA180980 [Artemisia annua]|uniref:Uncharacterized protein n=1 Tax=Artemisia annua TaxID=35608 RepID=A0A2U1P7A4_ARTAN|nr:hypothetical protein CTI12_AA180980 [Artemisia annua]